LSSIGVRLLQCNLRANGYPSGTLFHGKRVSVEFIARVFEIDPNTVLLGSDGP
jgi:hypothetical protein